MSKQDLDNAQAASRSAEAAVASAKAAVETARIDVGYTQVHAPISGSIGRSLVTEGALVKAAQDDAIATIAQLDPIYVDVTESSASCCACAATSMPAACSAMRNSRRR